MDKQTPEKTYSLMEVIVVDNATVTCLVSATVRSTPSLKNTKYMYALGLYESGCPYGAGLKYKGDPRHILFSSGKLSTERKKG